MISVFMEFSCSSACTCVFLFFCFYVCCEIKCLLAPGGSKLQAKGSRQVGVGVVEGAQGGGACNQEEEEKPPDLHTYAAALQAGRDKLFRQVSGGGGATRSPFWVRLEGHVTTGHWSHAHTHTIVVGSSSHAHTDPSRMLIGPNSSCCSEINWASVVVPFFPQCCLSFIYIHATTSHR